MKFNSSARFNRKSFNSEKVFDAGIHLGGTVTNTCVGLGDLPLSGWSFRKQITISNTGAELTDYQISFIINRSAGVDSGNTVYVGTKCQDDYDDIRFTKADGITLLDYWIESSSAATATIWVEVDTVAGSGDTTLYLYYGNGSAAAVSDGDATFDFFDDFLGTAIDTDKWTIDDATGWSVSGGQLKGTNTAGRIRSKQLFSGPFIAETWHKIVSFPTNGYEVLGTWVSPSNGCGGFLPHSNAFFSFNEGTYIMYDPSPVVPQNNWCLYMVWEDGADHAHERIVQSANSHQNDFTNSVDSEPITLGKRYTNDFTGQAYEAYWDWILVRKYAATEPTVSAWGMETTWVPGAAIPAPITEFGITLENTINNSADHSYSFEPADITATIELSNLEVMAQVFIDTTTVIKIPFNYGSSEITVGETITGATSGATGTVTIVEVTAGDWGTGDAEGYIYVKDPSGVFEVGEEINGSEGG